MRCPIARLIDKLERQTIRRCGMYDPDECRNYFKAAEYVSLASPHIGDAAIRTPFDRTLPATEKVTRLAALLGLEERGAKLVETIEAAEIGRDRYRPVTPEGMILMAPDVVLIAESELPAFGDIDGFWQDYPGIGLTCGPQDSPC